MTVVTPKLGMGAAVLPPARFRAAIRDAVAK